MSTSDQVSNYIDHCIRTYRAAAKPLTWVQWLRLTDRLAKPLDH